VEFKVFGFFPKSDRAKEEGAPAGVENCSTAPAGGRCGKPLTFASQCGKLLKRASQPTILLIVTVFFGWTRELF
jgi:hypothetical protein